MSIYGTASVPPDLRAQMPRMKAAMQSEADGAIDAADARALKGKHLPRVAVLLYPGLGHTLGQAKSAIEDAVAPAVKAPIAAMATWAAARVGRIR